jgi:hypothetical protein
MRGSSEPFKPLLLLLLLVLLLLLSTCTSSSKFSAEHAVCAHNGRVVVYTTCHCNARHVAATVAAATNVCVQPLHSVPQ